MASRKTLRILHCLRAPKGDLFRHVRDLIYEQSRLGYEVGLLCDTRQSDEQAEDTLKKIDEICSLGLHRIAMNRIPGLRDFRSIRETRQVAERMDANIIHGHGAKGGVYARFAGTKLRKLGRNISIFYSPHGGTLHYNNITFPGFFILAAERRLASMTNGIIFESAYSAETFYAKIGEVPCQVRVIPPGLHLHEFVERDYIRQAADFVFVGDLVKSKGADLFLNALSKITVQTPVTAVIAGSGPEQSSLKRLAARLGIAENVEFIPSTLETGLLSKGRCLVLPSRKETFPYLLLEAAGAEVPFIASDVGGIRDVFTSDATLVKPNNVELLREQMEDFLVNPSKYELRAQETAERLMEKFTVDRMADAVIEMYYTHQVTI